jgi:hypothetical protein
MGASELSRLLLHFRELARQSSEHWSTGFARGIVRSSKNPRWSPSERQADVMRRLFCERQQDCEFSLIEED